MTNYYQGYQDVPLQKWQRIANQACFETNQQVLFQQLKIKTQAERFFYMFTETPDLNIIISILNSGSDTLIFVLISYLAKNSTFLGKDLQNFVIIMQTIRSWQFRGFNFIRGNQPPFKQFVSRTIMTSIGLFLKVLYQNQQTSKLIIKYLTQMEPTYFKLLVLKTFIETIEIVDSEMGYMRYRTMVYSFQDNVIPMMCQTLMPFFYSIEEGVRISELQFMQSNLKVSQRDFEIQNQTLPITTEQQIQSQYVFMLLKKIIQFNYNITYSQYESEQAIDTCLITFPDKILEKIINYQFLNALFFIIQKVSDIKVGNNKNKYLQIGLDCLAKMLQSRLSYISEESKQKFIAHAINGLLHMLRKCQQIGSQTLLEGILICNKKLFINVQIKYLKDIINKNELFQSQGLYQYYLAELTQMIVIIIKKSQINADNNLLLEAVEVANKLIVSFRYQYRDEEDINIQSQFFMTFVKLMIDGFIAGLYQPKSIFHGDRIISLAENKLAVSHLFDCFKKAASYNYGYFFGQIQQSLDYYLSYNQNQRIGFANILFLVSEIIDHNYTDRNVYLTKAKDSQLAILGVIVQRCTTNIKNYLQSRRINIHSKHSYLDTAVIIFTQSLMLQFLSSFQGNNGIRIKQKLYVLMKFGQNYNEFFDQQDHKSEQTIHLYFIVLFQYINCQIIDSQDEIKMLYCLDVIEKCIFKLKWNMKRQSFIKSLIFKFLEAQFQNLYNYKTVMDIRSRASKIMVTLTFDDILDQYKFRINKFVSILKTQQMEEVILYDLIGIFEGIQTNAISKFFCLRLNKQIDMNNFFIIIFRLIFLKNEQKFSKDVCRLCKLIITNKGIKISNNPMVYNFLRMIIPNVIILLKKINSTTVINYDFWGQAIFELIQMFNGMINGTHINIFLFQHSFASQTNNSLSLCKEYMIEFCQMITRLSLNIRAYPRLEEAILFFFMSANKQILNYVYSDQTGALSHIYSTNLVGVIDLTVHYITFLLDGNKILEERLIKGIDCLRLFYLFFNKKCKLTHKRVCIENLKRYYELTGNYPIENGCENKSEKLIFHLVSFILTNHKNNNSYLRTITKLIFQLNKNFKQYIIGSFLKLRIGHQKQLEVQNILNTKSEEQQQFVQTFKTWVKQFNQFK